MTVNSAPELDLQATVRMSNHHKKGGMMEHLEQPQMSESLLRQLRWLFPQLNHVGDAASDYPAASNRSW